MRRPVRIGALVLAGLVLFAVLLGSMVWVVGNTVTGRGLIERMTSRLTGGHVQLVGLGGSFPRHLLLERLQLRDARGVWLTADHIALDWSLLPLLADRLQIDGLKVARIDLQRLPVSSSASTATVSIPRIDVAAASIALLQVGAPLTGVAAAVSAHGSAHLRSLGDMQIDAAAQRIDGDGQYALQLNFDAQRMAATLDLHEPASGPLENILGLPGLGALDATLRLTGLRSAEQIDLTLTAGGLAGGAHGTLNLRDYSANLTFSFESPSMMPRPDLSWDRALANGRWRGTLKSPTADVHLDVTNLRLPGGLMLASLGADVKADIGVATLQTLVGGLRIPGNQPQLLEQDPVKIEASARLDEVTRPLELLISHRLFALHAQAVTAGKTSATLELRLPDIAPFAALAGEDLRGSALLKGQVSGDLSAGHFSLDAHAALQPGAQSWSAAVGDTANVEASGTLLDSALVVDSFKFSARALSVAAAGEMSRAAPDAVQQTAPTVRAHWNLQVSDLHTVSAALAGTLEASGTLQGPTTALSGQASLQSNVAVRGAPAGLVTAELKASGLPSAPSGELSAHGSLDGAPLNVEAVVERTAAGIGRALIREASWKSVRADGEVQLAADSSQPTGRIRLNVGQLSDLQDFAGITLAGRLTSTLDLRPGPQHARLQLQADAQDLQVGQLLGNAKLTGEGETNAFGFNLNLQVPAIRGAAASLTAAGVLNLDGQELKLSGALATYHGMNARLLAPARLAFADGLLIDGIKIGSQQAELDVQGTVAPTLDLHVSLTRVKPELVNAVYPDLLAAGAVEARADVKGTLASPIGQIELTATGLRMADDAAEGLPALDIKAIAHLMGNTAGLDAQLSAGSESQLTLSGHAPLAIDGALDLKVTGQLDVGLINPILEARGQHAAGTVSIDATVAGDVANPQIGGTLKLAQGSARDFGRGWFLTNITAELYGNAGTLEIKSFTASAVPGTVTVSGTVGVLQPHLPVDLKITAKNAQPIVSKLITANLDADLKLSGTARERLDLIGTVQLNRTLIGIPNGLPPNVAVLDVRRRGKTAAAAVDKPLVIGMDVTVKAPQQILVQGRGLDAEMGGELHVAGTTDEPTVDGGFDLQRGTFSIASNKLNFTAGRVGFNGAGLKNRLDPTLDFTAQAPIPDATATLRITGLADAPQFEFTSSPELPADEIMGRLLFNTENASSLTGLQLAQIAAALATLSGVGGDGLNPLVKLQKSLGLDRLSVGAGTTTTTASGTENTGASIEAGRYVSKRVYIEARQSTTGTSQLGADVDLTKHLKLQTRLGNGTASVQGTTPENDPGSSIGLFYQFEY